MTVWKCLSAYPYFPFSMIEKEKILHFDSLFQPFYAFVFVYLIPSSFLQYSSHLLFEWVGNIFQFNCCKCFFPKSTAWNRIIIIITHIMHNCFLILLFLAAHCILMVVCSPPFSPYLMCHKANIPHKRKMLKWLFFFFWKTGKNISTFCFCSSV